MVDPLSQRTVPTSLAEPDGYRISRNIRRPRHIREASTAQAHSPRSPTPGIRKTINHPNIETRGRTRRSAPTRRFFHRKSEIVSGSLTAHTRCIHSASAVTKVANTWHLPRKRIHIGRQDHSSQRMTSHAIRHQKRKPSPQHYATEKVQSSQTNKQTKQTT